MTRAQILERCLALTGAGLLFASWITQQFVLDDWNGRLSRLNTAEAVWDTTRSMTYLFNVSAAIGRQLKLPESQSEDFGNDAVSQWQFKAYELGAKHVEAALDHQSLSDSLAGVMEAEDGGTGTALGAIDIKYETLKRALEKERVALMQKKAHARRVFVALYMIGTTLLMLGTIVKWRAEATATLGQSQKSVVPGHDT